MCAHGQAWLRVASSTAQWMHDGFRRSTRSGWRPRSARPRQADCRVGAAARRQRRRSCRRGSRSSDHVVCREPNVEVARLRGYVELGGKLTYRGQIGHQQLARTSLTARPPGNDVCHGPAVHSEHDRLTALNGGDHPRGVVTELTDRYIHYVAQRSTPSACSVVGTRQVSARLCRRIDDRHACGTKIASVGGHRDTHIAVRPTELTRSSPTASAASHHAPRSRASPPLVLARARACVHLPV
jgi:hypothetical protein